MVNGSPLSRSRRYRLVSRRARTAFLGENRRGETCKPFAPRKQWRLCKGWAGADGRGARPPGGARAQLGADQGQVLPTSLRTGCRVPPSLRRLPRGYHLPQPTTRVFPSPKAQGRPSVILLPCPGVQGGLMRAGSRPAYATGMRLCPLPHGGSTLPWGSCSVLHPASCLFRCSVTEAHTYDLWFINTCCG